MIRRHPFTGTLRKANAAGTSFEVTVDKYLIDQGFLKEGETYDFSVEVEE